MLSCAATLPTWPGAAASPALTPGPATSPRMGSRGRSGSFSSRTGRSRACLKRARASSTSSGRCTRPRSSLGRTGPSRCTAGGAGPAEGWAGRGSGGGSPDPVLSLGSAGVGRTGVFITLSIVLERMRYEGVVDMFQTVKTLRTQRPAMVQTEVCRPLARLRLASPRHMPPVLPKAQGRDEPDRLPHQQLCSGCRCYAWLPARVTCGCPYRGTRSRGRLGWQGEARADVWVQPLLLASRG